MKWSGNIGFITQVEKRPSVYVNETVVKRYRGDVLQQTFKWEPNNDNVNDDLNIENRISIVADLFASQNFGYMKWIEFMGCKWKVKSVQVQPPRLILSIGDLYNG